MSNSRRLQWVLAILVFAAAPLSATAESVDVGQAAFDRKDYQSALKHWLPLANHGDMRAQLGVGLLYFYGSGVKQDYKRSLTWLRKAADQGSPEAQDDVGWQYETGHGVAQDTATGERWFLRSANQGYAGGMEHMAEVYIPENNDPELYFWYGLLARSNSEYVKYRDDEAGLLAADQKASVDKRLDAWAPVPERPSH